MDIRKLDLNLLIVFSQLLVDQSVSTAADNLGLTQPAVSNALRRLRTALKDDLFVRTHRGMQPTPYAERLAGPVMAAIDTLRDALNEPDAFDPQTSERRFTIAMTDIGEIYFTPKLMDALARLAPGCRINTVRNTTTSLNEALQDGTVDLAVGLLPDLQAGFRTRRLFRHRYVCLCRKDHPITQQVLSAETFCAYGHIRVIAASTGHGEVDTLMARLGIQRNIRLEVPHFVAVGHILQRTDLLATVPERYATSCAEPFGLASLHHPIRLPEIDINLFWHAKQHQDPANRWLRQLMVELFAD